MLFFLALLALILTSGVDARRYRGEKKAKADPNVPRETHYVVHIEGQTLSQLRSDLQREHSDLEVVRAIGPPGLFEVKAPHKDHPHLEAVRGRSDKMIMSELKTLVRIHRTPDPEMIDAWYLTGLSHFGKKISITNNATQVWDQYDGHGVVIGIVDDGVDTHHLDLKDAVNNDLSTSMCGGNWLPPRSTYRHGTMAAAVAVARRDNGVCGAGVAPKATLAAIRLLSCPMTDADEASALSYKCDKDAGERVDIYSSSWGPPDDGRHMEAPGVALAHAMEYCIQHGREGKGSIYVFAGGNGNMNYDSLQFDNYANGLYVINVGAIGSHGIAASYSERGAGLMTSIGSSGAPSRQYTEIRTSTYVSGKDNECDWFGGTSAAAPQVAGIAALILQKRPSLTWRDVQGIIVHASIVVDPSNADDPWVQNAAGLWHSNAYGFGLLTAPHALDVTATWQPVGTWKKYCFAPQIREKITITGNSIEPFEFIINPTVHKVEKVYLKLSIDFADRSDIRDLGRIVLVSPSGTSSLISQPNSQRETSIDWDFGSVRFWGENPTGMWRIQIENVGRSDFEVKSVKLCVYGE